MNENDHILLLDTLIQCDINPYRHYLSLPGDLVPWVLLFSVVAKTLLHYGNFSDDTSYE